MEGTKKNGSSFKKHFFAIMVITQNTYWLYLARNLQLFDINLSAFM
jgi:hypothetical protein